MGNVLRVIKRDILRLLKTPAALVVIGALLVLPSLYTWYNVIGFWNPYNNTGNLAVAVVNQDEGASSELTGEINVGDMVVERLKENDQLHWEFMDYDEAMADLESGSCYALFVIPPEFSADLLTITTGSFVQPELQYYVNEKLGPVSPKITDTGATTLDDTINAAFVSTVSETAAEMIDEKLAQTDASLDAIKSKAAAKMGEAVDGVNAAKISLEELDGKMTDAKTAAGKAADALDGVCGSVKEAADAVEDLSGVIASIQSGLSEFAAKALPVTNDAAAALDEALDGAHRAAQALQSALGGVNGDISAALAQARQAAADNERALAQLRELQSQLPADAQGADALAKLIANLEEANTRIQTVLSALEALNDRADTAGDAVSGAIDSLDEAARDASSELRKHSDTLFSTVIPDIQSELGSLSSAASGLSAAIGAQDALIDQTDQVLGHLQDALGTSTTALDESDALLGDLSGELSDVQTDILMLSGADALQRLLGEDGLDAEKIADFMGSPTELVTEQLYPLNAYGSAMAPLFMNLTFWIGAFMLVVILKQEVDSEGIRNLTLTQRYMGRFLLLTGMVIVQAVVCCAGVLVIGVQTVFAPALFFAAAVAALAYLSIIFALSVTMQHVGKGICIVLVFAQIPGATGLYPIEMTPEFFRTIYPFMPFTYGIGAMREAICGFYGMQYWQNLAFLVLFFAVFMAWGIGLRPLFSNVNRMFARKVREAAIINGENVEVPARRFRTSQVMGMLLDHDEYREKIEARYDRFLKLYPKLIRGSVVAAVAVPVLCAVVFALTPSETVVLITVWLIWFVIICIFLSVVESIKYSFKRQLKLADMDEEELRRLYRNRNHVERVAGEDGEA